MQQEFLYSLENTEFPISVKLHPKGNNSGAKHLSKYFLEKGVLSDHFGKGNIFAFDLMGSAMVEALAAGECVILWDTGIRHKSDYFESLRSYVYITDEQKPRIKRCDIEEFFENNSTGRKEYAKGFYE